MRFLQRKRNTIEKKIFPKFFFLWRFFFAEKKTVTENSPTIFMYENLSQHDAVKFLLYIYLRHFASKINCVTSSFFCYFRISAWGWAAGALGPLGYTRASSARTYALSRTIRFNQSTAELIFLYFWEVILGFLRLDKIFNHLISSRKMISYSWLKHSDLYIQSSSR